MSLLTTLPAKARRAASRGPKRARKAKAPKAAARPPLPLTATCIRRNLLATPHGLWAYYILSPQRWAFLSEGERAAILSRITARLSELGGHRIQLRCTAHPVPYSTWAERLDRNSPNRLPDASPEAWAEWMAEWMPDVDPETWCGETWEDDLVAAQEAIMSGRAEAPTTYLGVRLTTRNIRPEQVALLADPAAVRGDDLEEVRGIWRRITEAVAGDGFAARPVSSRGLGWLMHNSLGLGIPVDPKSLGSGRDGWGPDDMGVFTRPVYPAAAPFAPTVRIRASRQGEMFERHVAVLSVQDVEGRDPLDPDLWPWMSWAQQLPFGAEWSAIFDLPPKAELARAAEKVRKRAEAIDGEWDDHKMTPPLNVGRGISDAMRIEDEVTTGNKQTATRLVGPIRLAVWGDTEAEALSNARTAIARAADDVRVTLTHDVRPEPGEQRGGQFAYYQEFWPGSAPLVSSFSHSIPAYFMATAVPHATVTLGDRQGDYYGMAGKHAVMFDVNWGPEHNEPGVGVLISTMGGGKSTFYGRIAERQVRRGRRTWVLDPPGNLAKLCSVPYLRPYAKHVPLGSASRPGMFVTYRMVPEPRPQDYSSPRELRAAQDDAKAERCALTTSVFTKFLTDRQRSEGSYADLIEAAVDNVGGDYDTNPWRVVVVLDGWGPEGTAIAERLRRVSRMRAGSLVFPPLDGDEDDTEPRLDLGDATLTVITMRDFNLPTAGTKPERYTAEERINSAILELAGRYITSAMYSSTDPKTILMDEGSVFTEEGANFRLYMQRAAVWTRRSDTFLCIASQNPDWLLQIDPQVTNLVGWCAVGRMKSPEVAAAALKFLRAPTGQGYENALTGQAVGEWTVRDYAGNVAGMLLDRMDDLRPHIPVVLDATPAGADDGEDEWAVEQA